MSHEQTPAGSEVADFDAFFAEQNQTRFAGATLRLYGREYVLPTSLPLMFTLQMERVQNSSDPDDIRRLLASLFGPKAMDEWAEHGMTDRQLGVVLLWSAANSREPGSLSIAEAVALYDEQEHTKATGDAAGKAPRPRTRPQTRPKTTGGSSGTRS